MVITKGKVQAAACRKEGNWLIYPCYTYTHSFAGLYSNI
jgi:hypothetical protein